MKITELRKLSIFNTNLPKKHMPSESKFTEFRNLLGKQFNKWIIRDILIYDKKSSQRMCIVECTCGNNFVRELRSILIGRSKACRSCCAYRDFTSCEPKPIEKRKKAIRTFYDKDKKRRLTPEYHVWVAMRARCLNIKDAGYYNYGGRGIKICDKWLQSYQNFIDDMGMRPTSVHSLDRIDVNGNYAPENCRWATPKEQVKNRRNVKSLYEENLKLKGIIQKYKEKFGEID